MLLGFLHPKVVMPDCVLEEKELAMIFRHELLHEPCRKQVILLIRQWMEQRL